ncbi:hypothetical protein [Acidimangrovimonas sediminis]|uniref:hypothetical protein n=1 Tax=Acidimangrovimonas sediminis TaxID=2056283 RepID=UPI0011AF4F37|nr:hypothetical protein [Acidimangrovimonas sediminis]
MPQITKAAFAAATTAALCMALTASSALAAEFHRHKKSRGPGHIFPVAFATNPTPVYGRTPGWRVTAPVAPPLGEPELKIAVRPGVTPRAARIYTLGVSYGF